MTTGNELVFCVQGIEVLRAQELAADGWERRTVTDPGRIAEMEQLYASLGFETMTAPLDPAGFGDECNSCAITACSTYLALFTRKPADA